MQETQRIAEQLRRMYNGDAWHGPSVRAALDGVDMDMAIARPVAGAHSISELVLHLTAWTREVRRRLRLGVAQDPEEGDWPQGVPSTAAEWNAMVAALDAANEDLAAAIEALGDAELEERIGDSRDRALGSGVSRYMTLHGVVQHHAYHAGQISLLKNASRKRNGK
jgi:uncharacterized damage-inducible protein DinB